MTASILLVDDETPIVTVLTKALRSRGYDVRSVTSGFDALLALAEEVPDVMLLDVNLPDLTGWEVLRRLSPTDRERVPVIVFSASPLSPARVTEFHPAGVLLKPFPIEALNRLIADLVTAKSQSREVANA